MMLSNLPEFLAYVALLSAAVAFGLWIGRR